MKSNEELSNENKYFSDDMKTGSLFDTNVFAPDEEANKDSPTEAGDNYYSPQIRKKRKSQEIKEDIFTPAEMALIKSPDSNKGLKIAVYVLITIILILIGIIIWQFAFSNSNNAFKEQNAAESVEISVDTDFFSEFQTGDFRIISSFPADGAYDVDFGTDIVIRYSNMIKKYSSYDSITLVKDGKETVDILKSINAWNLIIQPKEALETGVSYKLIIPKDAVISTNNELISKNYSIVFTMRTS